MRLILEYGSLIWNPHSQHEIDMIEYLQSHFLKYAITNLSFSGPPTLELCRLCQVLQIYYSILNNSCCLKPDKFFVTNNRQNLSGQTLKIPIIRTSAYSNFFNIRYLNLWNSLMKLSFPSQLVYFHLVYAMNSYSNFCTYYS